MAAGSGKFKVKFPVIQLREEYGGKRAIVIATSKPRGDGSNVVLCTCMDQGGKLHQNLPIDFRVIQMAALRPVMFVETDETGDVAPSGLMGPDGRPL